MAWGKDTCVKILKCAEPQFLPKNSHVSQLINHQLNILNQPWIELCLHETKLCFNHLMIQINQDTVNYMKKV